MGRADLGSWQSRIVDAAAAVHARQCCLLDVSSRYASSRSGAAVALAGPRFCCCLAALVLAEPDGDAHHFCGRRGDRLCRLAMRRLSGMCGAEQFSPFLHAELLPPAGAPACPGHGDPRCRGGAVVAARAQVMERLRATAATQARWRPRQGSVRPAADRAAPDVEWRRAGTADALTPCLRWVRDCRHLPDGAVDVGIARPRGRDDPARRDVRRAGRPGGGAAGARALEAAGPGWRDGRRGASAVSRSA